MPSFYFGGCPAGGSAIYQCGIGSVHLFSKCTPWKCPLARMPTYSRFVQTAKTVRLRIPAQHSKGACVSPHIVPCLQFAVRGRGLVILSEEAVAVLGMRCATAEGNR